MIFPSLNSKSVLALVLFIGQDRIVPTKAQSYLYEVTASVTNLAPMGGTCLSPVWMGIHDGSYDIFTRGQQASRPLQRLAEDGNTEKISDQFNGRSGGVWDGVVGSEAICPGETAELTFPIEVKRGTKHYFSYATKVLPSNDAFLANANPRAYRIFTSKGKFRRVNFQDAGNEVLDAGTELNDELPENTFFLNQTRPRAGVNENEFVSFHRGFNPAGTGGILDNANFTNATFTDRGYEMMRVRVTAQRLEERMGVIKVRNRAPDDGTCQTPVWVGIHNGTFDLYDMNETASPGLQRLAETGRAGRLRREFAATPGTIWDGVVGDGAICRGDKFQLPFRVGVAPGQRYYFSYASMVIPSNDAFLANGDPMEHKIFSRRSKLQEFCVKDNGADVLDAGTEVNDELSNTTAFFGQTDLDAGTAEEGVVLSHPGFLPVGSGGILDDPSFENADFTEGRYPMLQICIRKEEEEPMDSESRRSSKKGGKKGSKKSGKGY